MFADLVKGVGILTACSLQHSLIRHGDLSAINGLAGALTLASVLLYPKTLGGGAVFSGWVPFNSSIIERISPEARKVC